MIKGKKKNSLGKVRQLLGAVGKEKQALHMEEIKCD